MRRCKLLQAAGLGCATAVTLSVSPAFAGSFTEDGSFVFDPSAVYTEGFEDYVVQTDGGTSSIEIVEAPYALQASKVAHVESTGGYGGTRVALTFPDAQAAYKASVWIRGSGSVSLRISYADGSPADSASMFPTGRMTSDEWIEMQTGVFDLDGPRGATVALSVSGASVDVDGFELVEATERGFHAATKCLGAGDPICGEGFACIAEWCRNTAAMVPDAPEGAERAELALYLQNRLQFFFGPYGNRRDNLPSAVAELQAAATTHGRWMFWNAFATAIHRLQDWYSSTTGRMSYSMRSRKPMNVCFIEGDADLSKQQWPSHPVYADLLVAYAGQTDYGWGLHQGDRIVAVDGKHPIEWMRSLVAHDWGYHASNDPDTMSDFAQALRSSIPMYARQITVIRCPSGVCGAPETIDVASIPEGPVNAGNEMACDQRPTYIVQGGPADHSFGEAVIGGQVIGTQPDEKIYGMVWDYLLGQGYQNDLDIKAQVATWGDAKGLILDHRSGYGGTIQGPEPILSAVRNKSALLADSWRTFIEDEGPQDAAEGVALFEKLNAAGAGWSPGSSSANTTRPVALLITLDGSASDYFPFAMKGLPNVRIFGPHATVGAFSSFLGMSYWNAVSFAIASQDTVSFEGKMLCANGVEPDEVVWPKQSDLLQGKDTLAERALAWVRAEVTP